MAGEPGQEDHAGLVEAGGGLEEVPGEFDGGVEEGAEALRVPGVEDADRFRGERAEGSKMPSRAWLKPWSSPAISSG
ncbi:hypothetical protein SHKM778_80730 [Streptomyces sp. KM77-8]|uniref:Uncharacterized protein n=1 Tax=Streptomyces haneummycinicus TaxID=3074435 RepID=A0AAT9HX33_9ACTN